MGMRKMRVVYWEAAAVLFSRKVILPGIMELREGGNNQKKKDDSSQKAGKNSGKRTREKTSQKSLLW